jgi:hypothetical protein
MTVGARRSHDRSQGQVIVIFAVALVALLAMTGLIIDGGHAWSQQRHVQNAADASARAGALVLGRRAGEEAIDPLAPPPLVSWGEQVRNEVYLSAAQNGVTVASATYTTLDGTVIAGEAVDGRPPPTNAAGVEVFATKAFDTSLVRIVGMNQWRLTQPATAVSGPSSGCISTLAGCALLPIAFPVTVLACGSGHTSVPELPTRTWETGVELTIPLCGGNPGSVGWIDWTVPYGGTSELEDVILDPPVQDIPLPSWKFITATGNVSAGNVEDALNTYAGQVVMFPMFDSTCAETPVNNELDGCPPGETGGSGTNQWYHIPYFLAFQFSSPKGAFTNGDYSVECSAASAKECIKGAFVALVGEGEVSGPCPPEGCPPGTTYAVQLIK